MRRLTASKLDIATACVWPWSSGVEWPDTPTSYSARLGKAFHAYAEHEGKRGLHGIIVEHGLTPAQVRKLHALCASWETWWKTFPVAPVRGLETKVQYEPMVGSADLLETRGERDYSQAWRTAIVGTADVVQADGGSVHVLDYKTGRWAPMPRESWQMRFLGLAFARVYDAEQVTATIVTLSEKEGLREWSHTYTPDELRETEDTLRRVHLSLAERPQPNPGDHCRWCPVRGMCPTQQQEGVSP